MRKIFSVIFIAFILFVFLAPFAYSWGFFAHKRINYMAVFTLPSEMIGFYKKHIHFISEHAVDPDRRRYTNANEGPRHYIDIDHFGPSPFDSVPEKWTDAVTKYSEDTLKVYGTLPWNLDLMMYNLSDAFKKQDAQKILRTSTELGHYIADAHVPLHTTQNHDGQLTNQKGIHAFWESRIPELMADNYNYFVGKAKYVDKPHELIWQIIRQSHTEVDSVLGFEAQLNEQYAPDKKYAIESKRKKSVKTYSEAYTRAYNKMLNGMVERRMCAAVYTIGCFWYTAWVNAGQPDLNKLDDKMVTDPVVKKQDTVAAKIGKEILRGHEE
ncbi:MAG: S1/P1 Nuclease [Bacteroidia bacterium]|nr:S1/P1 Nuclease [Bacteroidia bacterium]